MKDNKPFAMFFNVSPRKGWNTHKMLERASAARRASPSFRGSPAPATTSRAAAP